MDKHNFNWNYENSLELAEFIGWHIGDGCISVTKKYSEYALAGDLVEELPFYENVILPCFNKLFEDVIGRKITLKKYSSNNVCGVYVFNRDFVKFLKENTLLPEGKKINIGVPSIIQTSNQKIALLRGLFDTDGSIYFCRNNCKMKHFSYTSIFHYKPKIKLATISKTLILEVYKILCDLGFHPKFRKPARQRLNENLMYGVVLHRKSDIKKWIIEVGFKNFKHSTKIQVWQKFGFCPPHTKLNQRLDILNEKVNILDFYPNYSNLSLNEIKNALDFFK